MEQDRLERERRKRQEETERKEARERERMERERNEQERERLHQGKSIKRCYFLKSSYLDALSLTKYGKKN